MIGVYIIKSKKDGRYYIGSSNDISRRLYEHNHAAGGKYSSLHGPWELVWSRECATIEGARNEERRIKSFKGGNAFKSLVGY